VARDYSNIFEKMNPYQYFFDSIAGKWKPYILRGLYVDKTVRFSRFCTFLGVSEKVLSQQLKELGKSGLVTRKVYEEIPIRVEYSLTPKGESAVKLLSSIYEWGRTQMLNENIPIDPLAEKYHGYNTGENCNSEDTPQT
jgi:DNA-binding HxlR family transcriptional regulator